MTRTTHTISIRIFVFHIPSFSFGCECLSWLKGLLYGMILASLGFCLIILLPAYAFTFFERWDLLDALYYATITLTTVGFGDYVAGQLDFFSHRRNLRLRAIQRRSWRLKSCFRRSFLASGTKPEVAGSWKPEFDPLFQRNLPFHHFSWNYLITFGLLSPFCFQYFLFIPLSFFYFFILNKIWYKNIHKCF